MSGSGHRVIAAPRARRQVREAVRWYRRDNPQAAEGLRIAFTAARSRLGEAPLRWAEFTPGIRRYLLPRYPYVLIYTIEDTQVVVLAVVHHARHPDTWRRKS